MVLMESCSLSWSESRAGGYQECLGAESSTPGILNTSSTVKKVSLTLSHTLFPEMPPPPLNALPPPTFFPAFIIPFRAASSHLCFTCLSDVSAWLQVCLSAHACYFASYIIESWFSAFHLILWAFSTFTLIIKVVFGD